MCHCSTAPGAALFFVGGNVVSGRRKKDDDPAYAVYQSGAGRTAGRFDCVSGTAFVPVGGDIFLYAAAWSCMDTHTDRMDYRRVPAIGEAGKRAEKTGENPKQSGHRWRRKKFHRRRKTKKKHGRKEDSSTKKKNTAENKILEWNHCQISYDSFEQTYRMVSDSPEKILLLKEDKVLGTLEQGERVRVGRPVTLQIQGKEELLHLK